MRRRWIPGIVLTIGAALTLGAAKQRSLPLAGPLSEVIPREIEGYVAQDLTISDAEADVAGFSNYLFRVYERPASDSAPSGVEGGAEPAAGAEAETPATTGAGAEGEMNVGVAPPWFSVYVGYYESQARGKTIHSPKNCLPGAGWEPVSSEPMELEIDGRTVTVNRYILQNGTERSLALYWYQGRGRIEHDEYRVKFNLLWDAALRRRSDEALVRIVVPVGTDEEVALQLAHLAARLVIPDLSRALPT